MVTAKNLVLWFFYFPVHGDQQSNNICSANLLNYEVHVWEKYSLEILNFQENLGIFRNCAKNYWKMAYLLQNHAKRCSFSNVLGRPPAASPKLGSSEAHGT